MKSFAYNTKWNGLDCVSIGCNGYEATILLYGANMISLKNTIKGYDIIRTPEGKEAFLEAPIVYGIPILFPPNRIEDGKFSFNGKEYNFPINEKLFNNHIHGFLYNKVWKVSKINSTSDYAEVELVYNFNILDESYSYFPHEFDFILKYRLSGMGLEQFIEIKNTGDKAIPVCLGFHSAFNIPYDKNSNSENVKMQISIGDRIEMSDRLLSTGNFLELNKDEKCFSEEGQSTYAFPMDNHYTMEKIKYLGKDVNAAIISDVSLKEKIIYEIGDTFNYWMIWNCNANNNFVCPEPQTCTVNALNSKNPSENGVIILNPGEVYNDKCKIYIG